MLVHNFFRPAIIALTILFSTIACAAENVSESNKITPPRVSFETSLGNFTVVLNPEKAPITVANFLQYVNEGFYDGTIFHRVIDGFMVQGGGFTENMIKKDTRAPIKIEANNGLANNIGTIAMARTNVPDSATAQFFINVTDNAFLNHRNETRSGWGYTVFGEVVDGMETINAIRVVQTTTKMGHQNVPIKPVVILRASAVAADVGIKQ